MIVLFALASPAAAQVEAASHPDRDAIRLSQSVDVRLTLEGPAPLWVDLPNEVLSAESAKGWRARPLGPAAVGRTDGRGTWVRHYRLDPFDVPLNEPTTVTFASIKVDGRTVTWPPVKVTVSSVIGEAKQEAARPVTGIESLPPPAPPDGVEPGWVVLGVLVAVFVLVLVVGLVRKRRTEPPLPPDEWALAELERAAGLAGRPLADRVAEVLRRFTERRFHLPATRLTTAELLQSEWPGGAAGDLGEILDRCDRAKFAGHEPDAGEGRELIDRAKTWVRAAG